ncbi:GNAT family N-acetyltransferase [Paenibacillus qinlingensis]|uniref:GNAT family N-acetyltransferase n=1 Tax=Paenibacillus qinlingensis TaxID=1837343 RepID=UPI0037C51CED
MQSNMHIVFLLSEALRQLKDVGVSKVRLTVDSTNEVAKSLYKKLGFVHEYKRTNLVLHFKSSR